METFYDAGFPFPLQSAFLTGLLLSTYAFPLVCGHFSLPYHYFDKSIFCTRQREWLTALLSEEHKEFRTFPTAKVVVLWAVKLCRNVLHVLRLITDTDNIWLLLQDYTVYRTFRTAYIPHCLTPSGQNIPHCLTPSGQNIPQCLTPSVQNIPHCLHSPLPYT